MTSPHPASSAPGGAVIQVPGLVWTLVALALLGVGADPRVRMIGWLGVIASFALTVVAFAGFRRRDVI